MTWVATASISALAIAAIGTGTEMYEAHQSEEMQEKALENKQLQNKYNSMVRKNQTLDAMDRQLQTNEAHSAASGVEMNSPSVFAQNMDVAQQGQHAIHNSDVAESLNNYSIEMQKQQARQQEHGAMIEGGLSIAGDAATAGYMYKIPKVQTSSLAQNKQASNMVQAYSPQSGAGVFMQQAGVSNAAEFS
jgi:hypothetical protein